MTISVSIYGFGSAFTGKVPARDIDFLIVHPSTDPASCRLAIACKRGLCERVPLAHVTMLSVAEEEHLRFIESAGAIRLGAVRDEKLTDDLNVLVGAIGEVVAETEMCLPTIP